MPPPLPYSHVTRNQTQWCWAAVAHGVMAFYVKGGPVLTQCEIATKTLRADGVIGAGTDCCDPASGADPKVCNQPYAVESALRTTGNNAGPPSPLAVGFHPPWPEATLTAELDPNKRVFAVRVKWGGGGGEHFVTVYGYDTVGGLTWVWVSDPDPKAGPPKLMPLWELATMYRKFGVWSHAFLTQP